jgi:hypothetical protein
MQQAWWYKNTYNILVESLKGTYKMTEFGVDKCIIKIDFKERRCEGVKWTHLFQNSVQ